MKDSIHTEIENIGFAPFTGVNIEFPSKTFLSTLAAGENKYTNIYVYYRTNKDFAVLFPNVYEDSFRIDYYGNVNDIQEKVEELKQKIEKGEV